MTHARTGATATLLPNGKVLIAGGDDYIGIPVFEHLASAELYDPATRTFSKTGSMKAARSGAAAVLLRDGRVLIMGGEGCKVPARCTEANWAGTVALNSAELYDPATGRFAPTGSMTEPSDDATATLLPDGRVLVFDGGETLVEVYDPSTGRFSRAGALTNEYQSLEVAPLASGKVLVVGDGLPGAGVELFDPGVGRSRSLTIPVASTDPDQILVENVTLLADGRVLVWVFDLHALTTYLYTYDQATDAFAEVASLAGGWVPGGAALLRDGPVLFAGGSVQYQDGVGGYSFADSAGLYDPASGFHLGDFKVVPARYGHTMTALTDGTVLIAGGTAPQILSSAALFVP